MRIIIPASEIAKLLFAMTTGEAVVIAEVMAGDTVFYNEGPEGGLVIERPKTETATVSIGLASD